MVSKYHRHENSGSGQYGVCIECKKGPTKEGHDGCLGTIESSIWNACCGHDKRAHAYIQFSNGACISGECAVNLMKFLKPSIAIKPSKGIG